MKPRAVEEFLQQSNLTPLVRSTRSQIEIDYLPPYGDPEVSIPGEVLTYLVVSYVLTKLLDRAAG